MIGKFECQVSTMYTFSTVKMVSGLENVWCARLEEGGIYMDDLAIPPVQFVKEGTNYQKLGVIELDNLMVKEMGVKW